LWLRLERATATAVISISFTGGSSETVAQANPSPSRRYLE